MNNDQMIRMRKEDIMKADILKTMADLKRTQAFSVINQSIPKIISIEKERLPRSNKEKLKITYLQELEL